MENGGSQHAANVAGRSADASDIELSSSTLTYLLQRHAPVIRLSANECYFPCSVEFFIASSELWSLVPPSSGGNGQWRKVHPPVHDSTSYGSHSEHAKSDPSGSQWDAECLIDHQRSAPLGVRLALRPKEESWGGESVEGDGPPCYGYPEAVPPTMIAPWLRGRIGRVVDLKYALLFTYNGSTFRMPPMNASVRPKGGGPGAHLGDIEHVLVRVDADSGKVLECFMSAHGTGEGQYCCTEHLYNIACETDPDGGDLVPAGRRTLLKLTANDERPVIYASVYGHANYPRPGVKRRFVGFGDDVCLEGGIEWRPRAVQMSGPRSQSMKSSGMSGLHGDESSHNGHANESGGPGKERVWEEYRGLWGQVHNLRNQAWWHPHGEHPRQIRPLPVHCHHSIVEEGLKHGRLLRLGSRRWSLYGCPPSNTQIIATPSKTSIFICAKKDSVLEASSQNSTQSIDNNMSSAWVVKRPQVQFRRRVALPNMNVPSISLPSWGWGFSTPKLVNSISINGVKEGLSVRSEPVLNTSSIDEVNSEDVHIDADDVSMPVRKNSSNGSGADTVENTDSNTNNISSSADVNGVGVKEGEDWVWLCDWFVVTFSADVGKEAATTCKDGWGYALSKAWAVAGTNALYKNNQEGIVTGTFYRRREWCRIRGSKSTAEAISQVGETHGTSRHIAAVGAVALCDRGLSVDPYAIERVLGETDGGGETLGDLCKSCLVPEGELGSGGKDAGFWMDCT